jgi:hypothetical protein
MTRRPFDPDEIGRQGDDLEPTLSDIDRYLADSAADPSAGFVDHVMTAVAHEPMPRRGALGGLLAWFITPGSSGRTALLVATAVVAVLAVIALGPLVDLVPDNVGATPQPTELVSPSAEPSPSLTPSPSPSPRTRTPDPSERPTRTAEPSDGPDATDSPDATDDSPGPDDNSGPGSSDDGSSGSGSGSDDGLYDS